MTKEFYAQYIRHSSAMGGGSSRLQRLLYTLNPRKFRSCEYLVKRHRERGDKIIIFRWVDCGSSSAVDDDIMI